MLATPTHIGADLRAERERRELTLTRLARELRVQERYLAAIEAGPDADPADQPGAGYMLGYVRAYADYVGLDAATSVARYKVEAGLPRTPAELARTRGGPDRVAPRRRPLPRGLLPTLALLAMAVAFAAYYRGAAEPTGPDEAPQADSIALDARSLSAGRYALRADTSAWVRVRADGEVVLSAILVPGQVVALPATRSLSVDVRDAGAVRLLRGTPEGERDLGALGEKGRALTDLPIGPEREGLAEEGLAEEGLAEEGRVDEGAPDAEADALR